MVLLPADIPTGVVQASYYFVSEDNIDADTDPTLLPVTGNVTFTASPKIPLRIPSKLGVLVPLKFKGKFDAQGRLIAVNDPTPGMRLPATDSTLIVPRNYTWRVDFDLKEASNGHTVNIPSFDIQVPAGQTIDLAEVMPVDQSPGTITIAGPQGPPGPVTPNVLEVGTVETLPGTPLDDDIVAYEVQNGAATTAALNATYASAFPDSQSITYNPDGSVATVTENGVTTSYAYNGDGTVATDTRTVGGVTTTRTYTYTNGNLTGIEAA